MTKEEYFTGTIKMINLGSKGNRHVIKIDNISLSPKLQEKKEDMKAKHNLDSQRPLFDLSNYFYKEKVKVVIE